MGFNQYPLGPRSMANGNRVDFVHMYMFFLSHSQPHHLILIYPSQGDSGGPLIQRGSDRTGKDDVLIGIVSWGLGCADDNFPGGKSLKSVLSFVYSCIHSYSSHLSTFHVSFHSILSRFVTIFMDTNKYM